MPRKESIKATIAREYRTKWGVKMPTTTLAKVMYKENKSAFRDWEDARSALRRIEGKRGSFIPLDKTFVLEGERPRNPYKLPDSDETKFEPYIIKGINKLAVIADLHIPYHSIEAITSCFDLLKKEKPDGILIDGDLIDFYGLSRFMKDPRKRSVAHELKAVNDFLDILQTFGAKVIFKLGNHDERFEHYMMQKAPELLGIPEFELSNLLKCKERGIDVVSEKRIIKFSKLSIVHGHEFGQSVFSPVNIARGLFLRGKVSAMQGHNHAVSEHTEPNMNGEITTTWSLGCLCELNPLYLPINKWAHGFAIVQLSDNKKDFNVRNYRIYKGRIL
jgi:predicted phosphodiesterase